MKQDYHKAFAWLQKAAEQGNPQAQNILSRMYLAGEGVEASGERAFVWERKAAENGNVL
jgi:TPR repeat protein